MLMKIRVLLLLLSFLFVFTLPSAASKEKADSAVVLKKKGDMFYYTGRFPEALDYYTRGLDKAESEENADVYNACIGCIGNVYASIGDYNRCLYYYNQGYNAAVKAGNTDMQFSFLSNILACYCLMKDVKKAKVYFNMLMRLPVNNQQNRQYYSLYNQGFIAQAAGDYAMAEYYHRKALDFAKERNMPLMYLQAQYMELGNIALKRKDAGKAVRYFEQCRDMTSEMDNPDKMVKVYKNLSEAYAAAGIKDSAAKYKAMYLELSDTVFNKSQFYISGSKLFEYENSVNKKIIDSLNMRNTTQLVVIIVFVVMLVVLTVLYVMLRQKNRKLTDAQILLVSKNEELMKSDKQSRLLLEQYAEAVNGAGREAVTEDNGDDDAAQDETANAGSGTVGDTGADKAGSAGRKERTAAALLSEEQKNLLLNKINTVMADMSVISRSDFNLNVLAQMTGSNTKYVSWAINDVYGKNFRQFLSEYRIREACRRLSDREHYGNMTLQAIYEELGYNSAASFIQAFKKVNGMTPSTYQRLMANKSGDEA